MGTGEAQVVPISQLGHWAAENRENIQAARNRYDAQNARRQ